MAFELPDLPYAKGALAPHISERTMEFHHGKHHAGYVTKLNSGIEGTDWAGKSLEEIIKGTFQKEQGIFNNAAQVWNHTFFWNCMKPNGGGKPTGKVADGIKDAFGSYEKFVEEFNAAATGQFGSGWAWLVQDGGKLAIMKTPNAENPMAHGKKALLTVDVWEHAYYLDYQNDRGGFVKTVIDNLINWDFVNKQLG